MKNLKIKNNNSLNPCGKESLSGRTLLPKSGTDAPTVLSTVYTDSTLAKNRQADVPQYGRSMIEMLGVLAIIGVLSVGGIAGYSKAMMKYRINKTIEQITLIAGNFRTFYSTQPNYAGVQVCGGGCNENNTAIAKKAKLIPDEMLTITDGKISAITNSFGGSVAVDAADRNKSNDSFLISFDTVPEEACIELATYDWSNINAYSLEILQDADTVKIHTPPVSVDEAVTACQPTSGSNIFRISLAVQ
ncbi:MAG: hypothetical protein IJ525_05770 [Alphaproteobacteria bacterium]|nr:hypothetical protein [Alphaproteobacteria bacterium]